MKRKEKWLSKCIAMFLVVTLLVQPVLTFADTLSSEPSSPSVSVSEDIPTDGTEDISSDTDSSIDETVTESTNPTEEIEADEQITGTDDEPESTETEPVDVQGEDESSVDSKTEDDENGDTKDKSLKSIFTMISNNMNRKSSNLGTIYKKTELNIPRCTSVCGKFELDTNDYGNNIMAFCGNHSRYAPASGLKITKIDYIERETSSQYYYSYIYKVLWYGYGGPGAILSKTDANWIRTSMALSKANKNIGSGNSTYDGFLSQVKKYDMPPKSFKVYRCIFPGKQDIFFWTYNPKGNIKIDKDSTVESLPGTNGYTLQGAKYGIYTKSSCTKASRIKILKTGEYGLTDKVTLEAGIYYIKEIEAPAGFKLSTKVTKVVVTDGCDKTIEVKDVPKKGSLKVEKVSASPEITNGNSKYSYKGAEYGVYKSKSDAENKKNRQALLTTNKKGVTGTFTGYADTYYVRELEASPGYDLDKTIHKVELKVGSLSTTKVVKSQEPVGLDPIYVLLYKEDADGNEADEVGDATLAGAQFEIKFYAGADFKKPEDAKGKKYTKRWVLKTNKNGVVRLSKSDTYFVEGDDFYYNSDNVATLPPGCVIIKEIKAPKGYQKTDKEFLCKITIDGSYGVPVGNKLEIPTIDNKLIAGDVEIKKVDSSNGQFIEGVKFDIIEVGTNKVVKTITTDENGFATTADKNKPDSSLPFGKYIIKETSAPAKYAPLYETEINIKQPKDVIEITVENDSMEIGTTATDKSTGTNVTYASTETEITDTVKFKNARIDENYLFVGYAVDKETEEPIKDNEGNVIVSEKEVTTTESDGTVDVEFTFDSSDLKGKDIVFYEEAYLVTTDEETNIDSEDESSQEPEEEKRELVAEHKDINDSDQTITFIDPKIGTTAKDAVSLSHEAQPAYDTTIIDTAEFDRLIPGIEHNIRGVIMDKETGKPVLDKDGNEIVSEKTFIPAQDQTTIDVEFIFDSMDLIGKDIVVFEYLYYDHELISSHEDINDEGQTIKIKEEIVEVIKKDKQTEKNIKGATLQLIDPETGDVLDEWVSDKEAHKISKLIPGKKYIIRETVTPNTYDFIEQEVEFIAGEENVVNMYNLPIKISGDIDKRQTYFAEDDKYAYTIDYRSTSNTWADEYNMIDKIDCAMDEYAQVEKIKTPVAEGDYDSKMNVWYKTNKTPSNYTADADKYNACSTNPYNPRNPKNKRVTSYAGWKLWKSDVSTLKSQILSVSDLELDNDEYIIGIAFEHGRVEKGFKTRSEGWNRENLKSTDDTMNELITVHDHQFKCDGMTYNYEPAVFYMDVVNIEAASDLKEFWNRAEINIYRNLGDHPDLEDKDKDKVVQKYPIGSIKVSDEDILDSDGDVQTGDNSNITIFIFALAAAGLVMIALLIQRRRGGSSDENIN